MWPCAHAGLMHTQRLQPQPHHNFQDYCISLAVIYSPINFGKMNNDLVHCLGVRHTQPNSPRLCSAPGYFYDEVVYQLWKLL